MSDGLYLVRMEQSVLDENGTIIRATLFISLYDGEALKAIVSGDAALSIYEHFMTLTDHAVRDSYVDGVLTGMRSGLSSLGWLSQETVDPVLICETPLSPDARVQS